MKQNTGNISRHTNERAVALEDGHVKSVAMTVANKDIPSIRNIDTIREVGD